MVFVRFREATAAIAEVLRHSRPPLAVVSAAALAFVVVAFVGAVPPLFAARIIDALTARNASGAFSALAWYAGSTATVAVVQLANNYLTSWSRETVVANLRIALMHKLDRARFDDVADLTLGEISNRIAGDIDGLCSQLQYSILPTLQGLVSIVATVVVMLPQNAPLTGIALIVVVLLLIPIRLVTPHLSAQQRKISATRDRLIGTVNETASLGALALLRDPRARSRERSSFSDLSFHLCRLILRQIAVAEVASFATTLISLLGPAAILGVGTMLLIEHRLNSVGTIIAFLMYYNRLASPFASLSGLPLQLSAVAVIARRLMDIFSLRDERGGDLRFRPGTIELRAVGVRRGGRAVLKDVDLVLPAGTHVALVGPSGSGKSTIASLFARYYDAGSGEVRVGGVPIDAYDLASVRTGIAIVSQDQLLFDAGLRENVTFINPEAPEADIVEALALCELEEVALRLGGTEGSIGQRGYRLSGGERARVCLARALLGAPLVLVLDEALASVDAEMEERIMRRVRQRMRGRTMVVITHRLRSASAFDTIAVVEGGTVAAHGDEAAVRATSPWYRATAGEMAATMGAAS